MAGIVELDRGFAAWCCASGLADDGECFVHVQVRRLNVRTPGTRYGQGVARAGSGDVALIKSGDIAAQRQAANGHDPYRYRSTDSELHLIPPFFDYS